MLLIRSVWFWLATIVLTGILSSVVVIAGLVRVRGPFYTWIARKWSRMLVRLAGANVRIEGEHNAPTDQPRIYVSNHQSWFDVWALAAELPVHYRFVAKKELARIPIFGLAWKAAGHVCIDRSDRSAAVRSLEEAGNLIRSDGSGIIIFPEGTRSPDGRLQSFKKGAFMLALYTGVDIVPIGISGSRQVLPKGSFMVRPGTITIRIGRPIQTAEYSNATRDIMVRDTRDAIRELIGSGPATPAGASASSDPAPNID